MIKINTKLLIGVAPFAAYKSKIYPLDKMKKIINILSKDYTVVLFGGGKNETKILDKIANQSSSIISFSGKFTMEEEIQLMSHLKLMISMDSGNAHMAAMMGVKVITLWELPILLLALSHLIKLSVIVCLATEAHFH